MEIKDILLIALPIASSYLTYFFTSKAKKNEAIIKFKEEKYSNLIIALQGFTGNTVSVERKVNFFEEQYKSWLYSSDSVVLAINRLIKLLIEEEGKAPTPLKGKIAVGSIILEMRKDLMGKTKLTPNDFTYTSVMGKRP